MSAGATSVLGNHDVKGRLTFRLRDSSGGVYPLYITAVFVPINKRAGAGSAESFGTLRFLRSASAHHLNLDPAGPAHRRIFFEVSGTFYVAFTEGIIVQQPLNDPVKGTEGRSGAQQSTSRPGQGSKKEVIFCNPQQSHSELVRAQQSRWLGRIKIILLNEEQI
jgi:hypothetical protein